LLGNSALSGIFVHITGAKLEKNQLGFAKVNA